MASKELSIIIKARDLASAAIKGVRGQVKGLGDDAKKAVSNASRNLTRIGVAAAGALAFAVGEGIRSITAIQKAQAESQQLIKSTGAAAGQTMDMLIARSQKWEAATGKNEEDIQHLQNVLLTFTKIGPTVFDKATEAALNMSQVLGQDLQLSAIQLGKALNDPVKGMTALRRVGVSFTEEQIAQVKKLVASGHTLAAQELILAELNTEFGGQAAKYGQTLQGQWDRFKQTVQEAERALATAFLPVLTKVGAKLNEFLGRKDVQAGIANLGAALARNLDKVIGFVEKLPWQSIGNAFKLMGQGAQAALDLFLKAPPWLQTAVLTGWGLNKLTGGSLGDIVGKLAGGLIKGVLGINAGVVNAKAAVVNVAGGVPGGGGAPLAGGKGLFGGGVLATAAVGVLDVAAVAAAVWQWNETKNKVVGPAKQAEQKIFTGAMADSDPNIQRIGNGIAAIDAQLNSGDVGTNLALIASHIPVLGDALGNVDDTLKAQRTALLAKLDRLQTQDAAAADKAMLGISRAIYQGSPAHAANQRQQIAQAASFDQAMIASARGTQLASQQARDAVTRQNPELAAIRASSAITAAKKTSISVHATIPVSVTSVVSIDNWTRKQVAYIRANAGSGGFI